jgi:hypothetical protein
MQNLVCVPVSARYKDTGARAKRPAQQQTLLVGGLLCTSLRRLHIYFKHHVVWCLCAYSYPSGKSWCSYVHEKLVEENGTCRRRGKTDDRYYRGCLVPRWYSSLASMYISICIEHKTFFILYLTRTKIPFFSLFLNKF